jgi:hypothetical protein
VPELNISNYKMLIDKRKPHIPFSSLKFFKENDPKIFYCRMYLGVTNSYTEFNPTLLQFTTITFDIKVRLLHISASTCPMPGMSPTEE